MKVPDFGSLNYDYVYQVDHILVGGETSAALSMETHIGGKGLNQAIQRLPEILLQGTLS